MDIVIFEIFNITPYWSAKLIFSTVQSLSCVQLFVTPWIAAFQIFLCFTVPQFSSVRSLSHVWLFATPWTLACQASLSITNSQSLLRLNVHCIGDAIQPSHPLSSPSPPAFNLSQHQGLFKWVRSSHQVAKVLEFQLQRQSFQWIPRTDLL